MRIEVCGVGFLVGDCGYTQIVLPEGNGYRCGCHSRSQDGGHEECTHIQAVRSFLAEAVL